MITKRLRFRLPLPLVTILMSVLTLLALLAISTQRNLHRERQRVQEFLFRQGVILIRGLEAGARAGMMRMMWQEDHLQALVEEVGKTGGLAGIRILEPDGRVVADSHAEAVGRRISPPVQLSELLGASEARGWRDGDLYVVGKRFVPLIPGHMMGHMRRGSGFRRRAPIRVALVEMFLEPFLEAQKEDLHHAVLMGIVLLALGSASFYFIFVVQNLQLVRRTLRSMTTYTAHLVEHMPDGLVSVDPGGKILTMNGKSRELLGLRGSPVGRAIRELGSQWEAILRRVAEGQRVLEEEIEFPNPAGKEVPIAVSASRVRGRDGEDLGVVILLRDLREVRSLQEQVQRSERLAALGQLAAGVAHEIRNPLSSIRGFAQLFRKRFPDGSEDRRYAEVMIQEVDRLNRVISNLLDFARPKEPSPRETRPREMVEHAVALVRKEAEARKVDIEMHGDVGPQTLDPDQVAQAVLNLLLNALEAMETGGRLTVALEDSADGTAWLLSVTDNGPGISRDRIARLFDPFFTTKKRGTGLGLAIVHRIVENHGGTIEVQSEPGRGTTFRLRFPTTAGRVGGPSPFVR